MDLQLIAKVAEELHQLRREKAMAEYLERRRVYMPIIRELEQRERVMRRRWVKEFTRKQMLMGERIHERIEANRTLGDTGVV